MHLACARVDQVDAKTGRTDHPLKRVLIDRTHLVGGPALHLLVGVWTSIWECSHVVCLKPLRSSSFDIYQRAAIHRRYLVLWSEKILISSVAFPAIRSGASMEATQITAGSPCPHCGNGIMQRAITMPLPRSPGFSEVTYRCGECGGVVKRAEDDRFRERE